MMGNYNWLLALIPAFPLAGALLNLLVGRKMSKGFVHTVAVGTVFASFATVVFVLVKELWPAYQLHAAAVGNGEASDGTFGGVAYKLWTWIQVGRLNIDLAFRFDNLTAVMCLLITFVGSLIHLYSVGYMSHEPRYAAYFGYLNLFTGAMLILVLGDNLPVLFIGWEGVGLCSYLLIGFWFEKTENANAGRKAFVVNRIGDFAFILGICLLFFSELPLDFMGLKAQASVNTLAANTAWLGGERLAMMAGLLFFIGACGKSAQIPLYVWLPDAMAGPTPVSALIHAATMVTAGVYMIVRMSYLYASSATVMAIVAIVGSATALFAAIMAFSQTDLKKVLAYSTVSQLGFMFAAVGVGAWGAGIFHLVTHGFFKAGLFLGAGSVMHAMSGSGDITKMGGLKKYMPKTHISFLIYCLAIAGLPIFSGFFSKDEILAGVFGAHLPDWGAGLNYVLWGVLSLAAVGTAFYMFRLYSLVFLGECRADEETKAHIHESPWTMTTPLLVLAACTCVLGFLGLPHLELVHWPNVFHSWLAPVVAAGPIGADGQFVASSFSHLGDGLTLGLMAIATTLGAVGVVAGVSLYKRGLSKKVDNFAATPVGKVAYNLSYNKFYVDEIYEKTVIGPFRASCRALFKGADRWLIDTFFVGGIAKVVDLAGGLARRFQNGQVQRYLVMMVCGAAAIFWYARTPAVDFDYTADGNTISFIADTGGGAGAQDAKISWDFDNDGQTDAAETKVNFRFAGPGEYRVTLRMTDSVFGGEAEVTKTVVIEAPSNDGANAGEDDK